MSFQRELRGPDVGAASHVRQGVVDQSNVGATAVSGLLQLAETGIKVEQQISNVNTAKAAAAAVDEMNTYQQGEDDAYAMPMSPEDVAEVERLGVNAKIATEQLPTHVARVKINRMLKEAAAKRPWARDQYRAAIEGATEIGTIGAEQSLKNAYADLMSTSQQAAVKAADTRASELYSTLKDLGMEAVGDSVRDEFRQCVQSSGYDVEGCTFKVKQKHSSIYDQARVIQDSQQKLLRIQADKNLTAAQRGAQEAGVAYEAIIGARPDATVAMAAQGIGVKANSVAEALALPKGERQALGNFLVSKTLNAISDLEINSPTELTAEGSNATKLAMEAYKRNLTRFESMASGDDQELTLMQHQADTQKAINANIGYEFIQQLPLNIRAQWFAAANINPNIVDKQSVEKFHAAMGKLNYATSPVGRARAELELYNLSVSVTGDVEQALDDPSYVRMLDSWSDTVQNVQRLEGKVPTEVVVDFVKRYKSERPEVMDKFFKNNPEARIVMLDNVTDEISYRWARHILPELGQYEGARVIGGQVVIMSGGVGHKPRNSEANKNLQYITKEFLPGLFALRGEEMTVERVNEFFGSIVGGGGSEVTQESSKASVRTAIQQRKELIQSGNYTEDQKKMLMVEMDMMEKSLME